MKELRFVRVGPDIYVDKTKVEAISVDPKESGVTIYMVSGFAVNVAGNLNELRRDLDG